MRAHGFARQSVVTREPIEAELQHDLGGARRPAALALDILKPFQEAAHVEQQARELRPERVERPAQLLARRDQPRR